jgi:para-aminobenzoate synthetase
LIIDNYDSYSFNLVQLVGMITGVRPEVVTNDKLDVASAIDGRYSHLIISPGPGQPTSRADYGNCLELTRAATIPLLGVCLGHQGLAAAFGGSVEPVSPAHGISSRIHHDGRDIFGGLPQDFQAVRYHSLAVVEVPDCLEVAARSEDGTVMALRHRSRPSYGVQFHPESVLTDGGRELVANFLALRSLRVRSARSAARPVRGPGAERLSRVTSPSAPAQPRAPMVRPLPGWVEPERVAAVVAQRHPRMFWLDSSGARRWSGRFSYVGWLEDDDLSITFDVATRTLTEHGRRRVAGTDDLFGYLEGRLVEEHTRPVAAPFDLQGGWVGFLGYECKALTTGVSAHTAATPDAYLMRARRLLAFDHQRRTVYAISHDEDAERRIEALSHLAAQAASAAPTDDSFPAESSTVTAPTAQDYAAAFARVQGQLRAGNSYEVNLTFQSALTSALSPFAVYRHLRRINPSPYGAFLQCDGFHVLCSSPERFLTIDADRGIEVKPIKGTTPRDADPDRDRANRHLLAHDQRYRSENLMIVDLLRNDLGIVCDLDSVAVAHLMGVESYASVHQLVTTIRGRLEPRCSTIDAVKALFPPGSMTGAPKVRTMAIIDEVEATARGVYSGALGWLGFDGRADLSVVIRTLVHRDGRYTFGTGGGVTVQSDVDSEYAETQWKAGRLIDAVRGTHTGDPDPSWLTERQP